MTRLVSRILLIVLLSVGLQARAQDTEYAFELGVTAGATGYLGDVNPHAIYGNVSSAVGLIGRWNINPRQALLLNITAGKLTGNAADFKNHFPDNPDTEWEFSNSVVDVSAQYELSFFAYGQGSGFRGSRRFTPYIHFGLGATVGNGTATANLPLGAGVKYKLKERWNVGLDWTMHFSMSDKLDGIEDPYRIKSGFLKNKDSYSFTMLYLSYDLAPKCSTCHNNYY